MQRLSCLTLSFLLGTLALSACQSAVLPATATPTAANTATLAPTATEAPPTPTSSPAPTATESFTPTPTPDPIHISSVYSSTSPDGVWLAQGQIIANWNTGTAREQFTVIRADGTLTWTVVDQDLGEVMGAIPAPAPFHWSADGQALYWTHRVIPDGCHVEMNGVDLHHLNLTTGFSAPVLEHIEFWLALAPDESFVAYRSNGQGLAVFNLATGANDRVAFTPIENGTLTTIVWEPNSESFVFGTMTNFCEAPEQRAGTLYQANATTLVIKPLLENDERTFIPQAWDTADALILKAEDEQLWQLNPATGVLAQLP